MSIGFGIFLFVVGAILVWALEVTVTWIDLEFVGYILMAAGALVAALGLVFMTRKRRSVSTTRTSADLNQDGRVTRRESTVDDL
ncbi:MAG: DUF6458 family protein [Cryobacterium sp.]